MGVAYYYCSTPYPPNNLREYLTPRPPWATRVIEMTVVALLIITHLITTEISTIPGRRISKN